MRVPGDWASIPALKHAEIAKAPTSTANLGLAKPLERTYPRSAIGRGGRRSTRRGCNEDLAVAAEVDGLADGAGHPSNAGWLVRLRAWLPSRSATKTL